mmetsp:Transcript_31382/g.65661  ORF Transcript_31382/g.65661 Transcript_31382/m.65661 type:complete len:80 (-) Transcript_31382:280-519(-)
MQKLGGNLTLANTKKVFLNKAASRDVGDNDTIAHFISPNESSDIMEEMTSAVLYSHLLTLMEEGITTPRFVPYGCQNFA